MSETPSPAGKTWRYHFTHNGGEEIETGEFTGDEAAMERARQLSTSMQQPVTVERYGMVDWHYVDEADERS